MENIPSNKCIWNGDYITTHFVPASSLLMMATMVIAVDDNIQ